MKPAAEWSWWDETPWEEILRDARLILSPRQFAEWLKRPDVIERADRSTPSLRVDE